MMKPFSDDEAKQSLIIILYVDSAKIVTESTKEKEGNAATWKRPLEESVQECWASTDPADHWQDDAYRRLRPLRDVGLWHHLSMYRAIS